MARCCPETPEIDGIYKPLSRRLVDFGNEVYADCNGSQRVIMWVFSFYDGMANCKVCKHSLDEMYGWFHKYGLLNDPVRGVRMVVEDEPHTNMIYNDFGFTKLPMHIFTDGDGKIIDMLFDFPEADWLDKYILPYLQEDAKIL